MSKQLSRFVENEIGVEFSETGTHPLNLQELVGLSIRKNPKRAHLLVSEVLGKHIPQRPEIIAFSGRLLGAMVSNVLNGREETAYLSRAFEALRNYLKDGSWDRSNETLLSNLPENVRPVASIGYAETATSLGFLVADHINSWYIHSTRSFDKDTIPYGNFEESHSHATSHQLIPRSTHFLNSNVPIVLIDDEFSTGKTVINTITELHSVHPHPEYVVAALIDCRREEDRLRMEAFADSLGVKITVVAIASGEVNVPATALEKAPKIIEEYAVKDLSVNDVTYAPVLGTYPAETKIINAPASYFRLSRFGVEPSFYFRNHAQKVAQMIGASDKKTVVLGLEEFMYFPLRVAEELSKISKPHQEVYSSSTTQSPVAVIERDDYAISNGVSFMTLDPNGESDESVMRYCYNVKEGFERVIFILEPGMDFSSMMGYNGIIDTFQKITKEIVFVTLEEKELI